MQVDKHKHPFSGPPRRFRARLPGRFVQDASATPCQPTTLKAGVGNDLPRQSG